MFRAALPTILRLLLPLAALVAEAVQEFPRWTIQDCNVPSGTHHPVRSSTPNTLSLLRLSWVSKKFWLQFSWSSIPQTTGCNLKRNTLYYVSRESNSSNSATQYRYTFFETEQDWMSRFSRSAQRQEQYCDSSVAQLEDGFFGFGSYGFVTCVEDYNSAWEAARRWWAGIPHSFFFLLLMTLVSAALIALLLGIVVCVAYRRRLSSSCFGRPKQQDSIRKRKLKGTISSPQVLIDVSAPA